MWEVPKRRQIKFVEKFPDDVPLEVQQEYHRGLQNGRRREPCNPGKTPYSDVYNKGYMDGTKLAEAQPGN